MRKLFVIFAILLFYIFVSCDEDENGEGICDKYLGTYSGEFQGESPFRGDLYITISESGQTLARLEGTWDGENGYYGIIPKTNLDCTDGTVDCSFGFYLKGPSSLLCPPGECYSYSGPPCYCDGGAAIGSIEGKFTESGGIGVFSLDSGSADDLELSGGGTWTVAPL